MVSRNIYPFIKKLSSLREKVLVLLGGIMKHNMENPHIESSEISEIPKLFINYHLIQRIQGCVEKCKKTLNFLFGYLIFNSSDKEQLWTSTQMSFTTQTY